MLFKIIGDVIFKLFEATRALQTYICTMIGAPLSVIFWNRTSCPAKDNYTISTPKHLAVIFNLVVM